MKKLLCLLLSMVLIVGLSACGGGGHGSSGAELALIIVAGGTIDDKSFNQGAWEGIKTYADERSITYKYYQTSEDTIDAFLNAIDLAVTDGAKVVVTPGYVFEPAIYVAQDKYPDTKFILLDGVPNDGSDSKTNDNVCAVLYAEEQAGFVAGYASVKEGYRKLGFMGGMAVPAVVKYGYGYIQGAELAAKELVLNAGDVEVMYTYIGNFNASPENQTIAASWYQAGTEVIFSCGGPVGFSVMAAAEQAEALVIGVDSDQADDSDTVITSAVKMLENSIYQILEMNEKDEFPGGKTTEFDMTNDGVGLPFETSRFKTFTANDYEEITKRIADDSDGIASGILDDTAVSSAKDISVSIVKVQLIEN